MRYTGHLQGNEAVLAICILLTVFIILFWFVPTLPRAAEKEKSPKLSLRASIAFGPAWFRLVGPFYRISTYDDFFLCVFFGTQKIYYTDVKNLHFQASNILSMTVHGVTIKIVSTNNKMKLLYAKLQTNALA
jgi:hypothetical protein